jgi:hypothetical protein
MHCLPHSLSDSRHWFVVLDESFVVQQQCAYLLDNVFLDDSYMLPIVFQPMVLVSQVGEISCVHLRALDGSSSH